MPTSSGRSSKPHSAAPVLRGLRPSDRSAIERILVASAAFREDEVAVALELVDAEASQGYRFVVAEVEGRLAGYACFGATPMTQGTHDLYWIVVDPGMQGRGVGKRLLDEVERILKAEGGRLLLIETAGKESYTATRSFYERCKLELVARVPDFYAPGDDKLVYARRLAGPRPPDPV